tara:strand:+ start:623 stop:943 length:321 start_codon:yes stop_codon:yes gene_type:complete
MKLIKNTWYRITPINGPKVKMRFLKSKHTFINGIEINLFVFKDDVETLIISFGNIAKIETYEETTVQQQAKAENRLDEYSFYGSLYDGNVKKRTKFNYNTVYEGSV